MEHVTNYFYIDVTFTAQMPQLVKHNLLFQSQSAPGLLRNFRIVCTYPCYIPIYVAAPLLAFIVLYSHHPHLPRLKYYTVSHTVRAARRRGLALTSIFLDFCCLKLCRAGRRCNLHFSSEELQSRIVQVSAAVHFTLT